MAFQVEELSIELIEALVPLMPRIKQRAYAGVKIRREYVEQRARETGGVASVVDDWEHGFPLLRHPDSAWRET